MSRVEWKNQDALGRRLREISAAAKLDSRPTTRARQRIREAIEEGHAEAILAGLDRYGRPVAPLAASTLATRDGTGPARAPHRAASRVITRFFAQFRRVGGAWRLTAGYKGAPFIRLFITGTRFMPRRDPAGITPKTWQRIIQIHKDFVREVARAGRRGG